MPDEAEQAFRTAITLTGDHASAVASPGALQLYGGEAEEALNALRSGVAAFPEDLHLRYLHGYALMQSLRTSGDGSAAATARREFEQSLELNRRFADVQSEPGGIPLEEDSASALHHFEAAPLSEPAGDAAKYRIANLHLREGRAEEGQLLALRRVRAVRATPGVRIRRPHSAPRLSLRHLELVG